MTVLPPGWTETTLEGIQADIPNAITGGPFGSKLGCSDYRKAGVPVIRGSNVGTGERRFYPENFVFVSDEHADKLSAHLAHPGDIILTQRGTLTQVGLVPGDTQWSRFVLSQSQMKLTCNPARADPEYIYYWLLTPEIRDYVNRHTIAAGVPHTNLRIMRDTPVRLPPLAQQRAIAKVLGCIDARANLANTMDDALDRLVRLLFRQQFLHDPNADPSAVPDGQPLPKVADFLNGSAFHSSDFCPPDEGRPIIKIGELKQGIGYHTRYANKPRRPGRPIDDGDILLSWSGTPQTSIGTFLWFGGPAWLNQHIFKIIPKAPHWRAFTYCLLRDLEPHLIELARGRQTTGLGHFTRKDMATVKVPAPSDTAVADFEQLVAPAFARIAANRLLVRNLRQIRETLLVGLTGGDLPIPDL